MYNMWAGPDAHKVQSIVSNSCFLLRFVEICLTPLKKRLWRIGLHMRLRLRQHIAIQSTTGQHAFDPPDQPYHPQNLQFSSFEKTT